MAGMDNTVVQESIGEAARTLSRLSLTACLRCREQKLRCGRERPICSRCIRLDATCHYPNPPNRRGPRSQRNGSRLSQRASERDREQAHPRRVFAQRLNNGPGLQQNSAHRSNATPRHCVTSPNRNNLLGQATLPDNVAEADDITSPLATGTPVLSDSYSTQLRVTSLSTTDSCPVPGQPPLPPTALGLSLLEIFFSRIYNASLLFHKPVLFQQYLTGEIHGALLKALLALATLFLRTANQSNESYAGVENTELKILSAFHSHGFGWAKAAEKEALISAVDAPSLMVTQALECLQLYWFGVGRPHSANLCLGKSRLIPITPPATHIDRLTALAYRSCHLLGYSKKLSDKLDDPALSLESELGRRCFWACWTSTCIVMEPEPYIKSCWEEAAEVPLPGTISNTSSGDSITLSERMDKNWHSTILETGTSTDTRSGAAAHLMKMVGLWAKVQLLCRDQAFLTAQDLDSVQQLSSLATSLFDNALTTRTSELRIESSTEVQVLYLVHDAIYHQSQIALHSTKVPLFSGIPHRPNLDPNAQRESAETVLKHAELFHSLLSSYISGQYHVSRLPPLVGYGAFVAGIVLLITEISYRERVVNGSSIEMAKSNFRLTATRSILRLLDGLRVYWPALQHPWETLHTGLETSLSKHECPLRPEPPQSTLDPLPAQVKDCRPPEISSGYNQSRSASDEQLELSVADSGAIQDGSHATPAMAGQVEAPDGAEQSSSLLDQGILPQDPGWYNPYVMETGVEQFVGLYPFTIFQPGWGTFG